MEEARHCAPSILLWARAAISLLSTLFFSERLHFSGGLSTLIPVSTTVSTLASFGFGDIDLDASAINFAVVERTDDRFALVLFLDEYKAKALGFATRSGGENYFVHGSVSPDHLVELFTGACEGQIANVEFQSLRLLAILLVAFLFIIISISNTDASSIDAVSVKGADGCFSLALSA